MTEPTRSSAAEVPFMGAWKCTIDEKRRLTLPAKLREQLAELEDPLRLIVTVGHWGCLVLVPPSTWGRFSRELFQAPVQGDPGALRLRAMMARYGSLCRLDSSGRITLNEEQMEFAGLARDSIVLGNFTRMEIWNPDHFEKKNPRIQDPDEHDRLAAQYLNGAADSRGPS